MLEVTSRSDAAERGLVNYFTGKPCKRGHVALRNVKGKQCVECRAEALAAMRERLGEDAWLAKERERSADYIRRNPEKKRASARASMARLYANDPAGRRAAIYKWRVANIETVRAITSRYHQKRKAADPAAVALQAVAASAKYRAKGSGTPTPRGLTAIVRRVWDRCGGKCGACQSQDNLELDHIVAVANGGTNAESNLQFLCRPCNRSKGARDFQEWLQSRPQPEGIAA